MEPIKMLYCENCHAPIPEDRAKCPYCGAFHASGGEKKYMERLYELKEDVEELSALPAAEYRSEMGKAVRLVRVMLLLFATAAAIAGILFYCSRKLGGFGPSEEARKAQMLWEQENFPRLDAMYDAGDYDAILEFEYETNQDEYHSLSNWKHYDFLNAYRWYLSCKEEAAKAAAGVSSEEDVFWCLIDAMFLLQEQPWVIYTEAEKELIAGYRGEVRELLGTQFGMQAAAVDALYEKCCVTDEYGTWFDYDTAKKVIKKYVDQNIK